MSRTIALFILLTLAFAGLFVADMMGVFNAVPNPIAVLDASSGTVRRLGHEQLTWDRAREGSLFASSDLIATGQGATAKVAFFTGGVLEMTPGTMVALTGDIDELKLNFLSGRARLRVSRGGKNRIKVTKTVKADQVVVEEVEKLPEMKVPTPEEVQEGKIRVKPEEVQQKTLAQSRLKSERQTLKATLISEKSIRAPASTLSTQGRVVTVLRHPPIPELLFPQEAATLTLKRGERAQLAWRLPKPKSQEEAAVLAKPSFYEVVVRPLKEAQGKGRKQKVIRTRKATLDMKSFGTGEYLWSVRSLTASGKPSRLAEFRMVKVVKPVPQAKIAKPRALPVKVE